MKSSNSKATRLLRRLFRRKPSTMPRLRVFLLPTWPKVRRALFAVRASILTWHSVLRVLLRRKKSRCSKRKMSCGALVLPRRLRTPMLPAPVPTKRKKRRWRAHIVARRMRQQPHRDHRPQSRTGVPRIPSTLPVFPLFLLACAASLKKVRAVYPSKKRRSTHRKNVQKNSMCS